MKFAICFCLAVSLFGAVAKQTGCVDKPRIKARKKPAVAPATIIQSSDSLNVEVELEAKPGFAVLKTLGKRGASGGNTITLTDAQLEKLMIARYGPKLVSQARAIYVHGLHEGTRSIPFD